MTLLLLQGVSKVLALLKICGLLRKVRTFGGQTTQVRVI
jgi:hypothetical protein